MPRKGTFDWRLLFNNLRSGQPESEPAHSPQAPLSGLDAIEYLHRQADGDFFVMNRLRPAEPVVPAERPAPAALPVPYRDDRGRILIPAVPLHQLET